METVSEGWGHGSRARLENARDHEVERSRDEFNVSRAECSVKPRREAARPATRN
jgi:hypothetical protein